MSLAVERQATKLWVLNVGDLKPYEREIEFFLTLGWNASVWNPNNINGYVMSWAEREFDVSTSEAAEIAEIVANLTRWNFRRKPEMLNSTTFSLINYRECVFFDYIFYVSTHSSPEPTAYLRDGLTSSLHLLTSTTVSLVPLNLPIIRLFTTQFLPVPTSETCTSPLVIIT